MDFSVATSKVFDRIREVDPENVTKIIGYLLLQEQGDKEMIRLAFGPDRFIHDTVEKAKRDLQQLALMSASPRRVPVPDHSVHIQAESFRHVPFLVPSHCWVPPRIVNRNISPKYMSYPDLVPGIARQGGQCFTLEDPELSDGSRLTDQHRMCLPDFPVKVHEEHLFSSGSLEKLEMEIVEILKSRRGNPLSIASLPMIYYDKYGKVLQGDGYLTESQRHGKAGHSLTKLLSRLGRICLIDRPHGQHAVMLVDDAEKYMESQNEKDDFGHLNSKSRQIYLTFPPESSFTEEDVADYFNNYGRVDDVRIPCQHKRMFCFVTFVNSDAVNMILTKGNPHFISGARVLVKPYKEKSQLVNRKYHDFDSLMHMPHYSSMDSKLPSYPRGCRGAKHFQNLLSEENERLLEYQKMRLAKLQLARKNHGNLYHVVDSPDGIRLSEEGANLQSAVRFNCLQEVLDRSGVTRDVNTISSEEEHTNDIGSQGVRLPESSVVSRVDNSISTPT